jgi:hypothetical protein
MDFIIITNENGEETWIRHSQINALQETDTTGNGDFVTKVIFNGGAEVVVQASIEHIVNTQDEDGKQVLTGL